MGRKILLPKDITCWNLTFTGKIKRVRLGVNNKVFVYYEVYCSCDINKLFYVQSHRFRNKTVRSCGCFRKEKVKTHGKSDTRLYSIWCNMKNRCYNKNSEVYKDYGHRSILICKEWKYSFEAFYTWSINNGYKNTLEIDRIDNNKGYYPDNCRWVTKNTQAYNKRKYKNNTSGVVGVIWVERDKVWVSRISVKGKRINLGSFINKDEAIEARQQAEIKYYGGLKNVL